MSKPKRKRLVRGKDWHAWAWKQNKSGMLGEYPGRFLGFAKGDKPLGDFCPTGAGTGRWVRVKFVEVKP